jgi:hypothetical protein
MYPYLRAEDVLSDTLYVIWPDPTPEDPEIIVTHDTVGTAVQAHDDPSVETLIIP